MSSLSPIHVDDLRKYITLEVFKAIGISAQNRLFIWLNWLVWLPASRFAKMGANFDNTVAQSGFKNAAHEILRPFIDRVSVSMLEGLPESGPLLIVANHAGLYDALIISTLLPRDDLKIVASGVLFLRNLPHTSEHLIFSTYDVYDRMSVIREGVRHLQNGGALLIFPGGHIEPDPSFLPGMDEAFEKWSPSIEIMLKKEPQTRVVVAIISHILSPKCWKVPLTRLRSIYYERLRIAEFIQMIWQMIFVGSLKASPCISFSKVCRVDELEDDSKRYHLLPMIVQKARETLLIHKNHKFKESENSGKIAAHQGTIKEW
jgi:hypothetical protein